MTDIAEGRLAVAKGCRYARLAAQQCDDSATQALASLGAAGKHPKNVERDFHRVTKVPWGLRVNPMFMELTLQSHLEHVPRKVQQPFFAPHEILHMWYSRNEPMFIEKVIGPEGLPGLKQYWMAALEQPWGKAHPVGRIPEHLLSFCVPILWHSDGAEFSNSSEAVIYSCASAMTSVCSWDCSMLLTFQVADSMQPCTNDEIVAIANWCGEVLVSGTFPALDHTGAPWAPGSWRSSVAGTRFAGPFVFAFAGVKGDMKNRRETHKFARHYGCNFMCDFCGACKHIDQLRWTDFSASAMWRRTLTEHETYIRSTPKSSLSPWAKHPGSM